MNIESGTLLNIINRSDRHTVNGWTSCKTETGEALAEIREKFLNEE